MMLVNQSPLKIKSSDSKFGQFFHDREQAITFLKKTDYFHLYQRDFDFQDLIMKAEEKLNFQTYSSNSFIFTPNDKAVGFYLVLKGTVACFKAQSQQELIQQIFWLEQIDHLAAKYNKILDKNSLEAKYAKKELDNGVSVLQVYQDLKTDEQIRMLIKSEDFKEYFVSKKVCRFKKEKVAQVGDNFGSFQSNIVQEDDMRDLNSNSTFAVATGPVQVAWLTREEFLRIFYPLRVKIFSLTQSINYDFNCEINETLVDLCCQFRTIKYTFEDIIFKEKEKIYHIYYLATGTIQLRQQFTFTSSQDNYDQEIQHTRKIEITKITSGEFFGLEGIEGSQREFSAISITGQTEVYTISLKILQNYQELLQEIKRKGRKKLRWYNQKYTQKTSAQNEKIQEIKQYKRRESIQQFGGFGSLAEFIANYQVPPKKMLGKQNSLPEIQTGGFGDLTERINKKQVVIQKQQTIIRSETQKRIQVVKQVNQAQEKEDNEILNFILMKQFSQNSQKMKDQATTMSNVKPADIDFLPNQFNTNSVQSVYFENQIKKIHQTGHMILDQNKEKQRASINNNNNRSDYSDDEEDALEGKQQIVLAPLSQNLMQTRKNSVASIQGTIEDANAIDEQNPLNQIGKYLTNFNQIHSMLKKKTAFQIEIQNQIRSPIQGQNLQTTPQPQSFADNSNFRASTFYQSPNISDIVSIPQFIPRQEVGSLRYIGDQTFCKHLFKDIQIQKFKQDSVDQFIHQKEVSEKSTNSQKIILNLNQFIQNHKKENSGGDSQFDYILNDNEANKKPQNLPNSPIFENKVDNPLKVSNLMIDQEIDQLMNGRFQKPQPQQNLHTTNHFQRGFQKLKENHLIGDKYHFRRAGMAFVE